MSEPRAEILQSLREVQERHDLRLSQLIAAALAVLAAMAEAQAK